MPQKSPAGFIASDASQSVAARNLAPIEHRKQRFCWPVTGASRGGKQLHLDSKRPAKYTVDGAGTSG